MALPKKRKLDLSVKSVATNQGVLDWTGQFFEKNKQFLPRDVDLTDLDAGFKNFIDEDLKNVVKQIDVPVYFFGIQRWNEFYQSWTRSDKYKNVEIPFISIHRETAPETGTNPVDFKIPVRKNFPYATISTWDGNRKNAEIYTIPNPVGVDMLYTVRFFTYKMRELNEIHKIISELFASAQAYVNVKGHYFPILLESIDDESEIEDLEGKRFYVQAYEMRLQGYIVDSEEFEVKPAVSRVFVSTEIIGKKPKPIVRKVCDTFSKEKTFKLIIQFLPSAYTEIYFGSDDNAKIVSIETENITDYTIKVNNMIVSSSFEIKKDDIIFLSIVKTNSNETSEIVLNGNVI